MKSQTEKNSKQLFLIIILLQSFSLSLSLSHYTHMHARTYIPQFSDVCLSSLHLYYHPVSAKLARLSLSLPPLALSHPLSPNAKGGFWEGGEHRGGRRRVASTGSDPDEDEEEEQEDESPRRVIVVTETDVDKRVGLRSLLKSPKEPVDKENRDRGRNVSFFDDVTVYLFDQVCQGCLYKKNNEYLQLQGFTLLNVVCFDTSLYFKTLLASKLQPMN